MPQRSLTQQFTIVALTISTAGLTACIGPSIDTLCQQNETLREQVLDLEDRLADLQQQNRELKSQLSQAAAMNPAADADLLAATPQVSSIRIGKLSHARDSDEDEIPDQLILYIKPADGRGRFLQLVGALQIHVLATPPDRDAVTITSTTYDPPDIRDAYRSGLTGTHYTLDIPLPHSPLLQSADISDLAVIATFTDLRTGAQHRAERLVTLR